MKRRDFLGAMIALPVSTRPVSAFLSQQAARPNAMHLDLVTARSIRDAFLASPPDETDVLDLSSYQSASVDAIRLLASLEVGFAAIGLNDLDIAVAEAFAAWKTYFLLFDYLQFISVDAASALGSKDAEHALAFSSLKTIDSNCAAQLVKATGGGNELSIRLSSKLTSPIARALAEHRHELSIDLDSPLLASVAKALSFHKGYALTIRTQQPLTNETIQELQSNSTKHLSITAQSEISAQNFCNAPIAWTASLFDSG